MKLIHTSDLHIGRRLGEYSLMDDQRAMLDALLILIRTESPDALLIAGDVYDKTVPSAEAVGLLDEFLTEAAAQTRVFLISGNHDSPERIAFGGRLMEKSGLYVCGVYDGQPHRYTVEDEYGTVSIWLLPFLRPADVRRRFPEGDTETYDTAFGTAVAELDVDGSGRNVILSHQFVMGSLRTDSETVSVGGTDAVDASHFAKFDYAALGHLHRAQNCHTSEGGCIIRYSGTPIAYSVSEANDEKSVTVVEMGEKGSVSVRTCSITPYRRMYRLRGSYETLMSREYWCDTDYRESYVQITLTDEDDIPDALYRLRTVYPFLLRLEYDNTRTRTEVCFDGIADAAEMDPAVLFETFYREQNGLSMDDGMTAHMRALIDGLWRGDDER